MTVMNNEVVGYIHCPDCGERGTLHMTKRGRGRNLYKRCGCGCDQRTGAKIQAKWREDMQPLPGFEDMKTEPEKQPEQQPEQPQAVPEQEPERNGMTAAPFWVALIVGSMAMVARAARGA
jgi:hypothetical protein